MAKKSDALDRINNLDTLNSLIKEQMSGLQGINTAEQRRSLLNEQIANYNRVINELQKEHLDGTTDNLEALTELQKEQRELIQQEKDVNAELNKGVKKRQQSVDLVKQLSAQLKIGWKYLQDQDKIIKSTVLNLGMSGAKAVMMRDAFEKSAGYITRLGGTIADIQGIMQGYADETGRARVMSAEMVKDITAIGKGTGLGIEQATRLGAQFELMGFDAKTTMEYVQGVVDTSERMGVNTTKVLKVVNDNFKKLNTYTFQQGVKGFAEMATYAEKFKIDIGDALNAADVARSLEGAVDLAAQLQVMGGEFAKTDPFEMLFLSRNDPAKFTEKIADMTKGVVSFRKMADGSFEKFISPADRDRLANVAKSMGMEANALTEIAQRQAEIQRMRTQMAGMGLSDEQKKLIEGAAIFDTKSGKFQVQLGTTMKNISELTGTQADSFVKQQVSLEERAKQAMTFDETFNATIQTLKAALLPILKGVNKMLVPLAKVADWFSEIAGSHLGWAKAGGILLAGATAWKFASIGLSNAVGAFTKSGMGSAVGRMVGGAGAGAGGLASAIPATGAGSSGLSQMRAGKGALAAGKGAGLKSLGKGAGLGVAMVGAGAGVMLAAKGVSQLADAMSKLTPDQAKSLESVVKSLSWFMVGAAAAAVGIMALGAAGTAGAVGLIAFGGAMALIGGGIFLATKGIGEMAKGLAKLNESGGGAGKELLGVATGVGAITLAMGAGGLLGLSAFNLSLRGIAKRSDEIEKIGTAFANIKTVLSGTKNDFIAVENAIKSIGNSNIKGGGMFAQLGNLLKKPLQVEFAKGTVSLNNDITLQIDKTTFMRKVYDPQIAIQMQENLRTGK